MNNLLGAFGNFALQFLNFYRVPYPTKFLVCFSGSKPVSGGATRKKVIDSFFRVFGIMAHRRFESRFGPPRRDKKAAKTEGQNEWNRLLRGRPDPG